MNLGNYNESQQSFDLAPAELRAPVCNPKTDKPGFSPFFFTPKKIIKQKTAFTFLFSLKVTTDSTWSIISGSACKQDIVLPV